MKVHGNDRKGALIVVGAIIVMGGITGISLGRRAEGGEVAPPTGAVTRAAVVAPSDPALHARNLESSAVTPLDDGELARLGAATMAGPSEARLAAIERLARAPRDQAIPILTNVMLNGQPGVDRPAALLALRELALAQGDADERIRDAVREVIYHGDDDDLAAEAQDTLDVIGEWLSGAELVSGQNPGR